MSELNSGEVEVPALEIVFVDASPPPLPSGDFRITVQDAVAWSGGSTAPFSSQYDFTVAGPRFTFDPALVHSMFPPPGNRGHFQKYLPHLVLSQRTLPWQRTVDGSLPSEPPFIPWLWLVSLDEDDIAAGKIAVKTVTVQELLTPPARILGPDIRLETGDGDPAKTQLMVVDIPTALINTLVPSKEDATACASARLVSLIDKEIPPLAEPADTGWFSVVMGNRFPKNGKLNTQYLLSMEGYGSAKTNIFFPNQVDPAKYDAVRLVMFVSWSFTNIDDGQTFDQLMKNLTVGRLAMPKTTVDPTILGAFDMGFTALDHITRAGEPTVSWYRGPLLPMRMPLNLPPAYPDGIYPNNDAPLRFDPETGMFDVSVAAAWQLGRLLGMQDGEFAAAIARLRDTNIANMRTLASRSLLLAQMGEVSRRARENLRDFKRLLESRWFDEVIMELWGGYLAPALAPHLAPLKGEGEPRKPLLGPPADPSGLRRHIGAIPGLLSAEALEHFVEESGGEDATKDSNDVRMARLLALIRDFGGRR
jgi:hypothetical protein